MSSAIVEKKITNVKQHIKRIFPKASVVDIDWRKKPNHKIEAKIEVKVPRKKLIAIKADENLRKAIDKSYGAIIKQLKKVKAKNKGDLK